jgi:hypothetical protein
MIAELAQSSGFQVAQNFSDSDRHFVDSLWKISQI